MNWLRHELRCDASEVAIQFMLANASKSILWRVLMKRYILAILMLIAILIPITVSGEDNIEKTDS